MMRLTEDTYDPTYATREIIALDLLLPAIQAAVARIADGTPDPEECQRRIYASLAEMCGVKANCDTVLINNQRSTVNINGK